MKFLNLLTLTLALTLLSACATNSPSASSAQRNPASVYEYTVAVVGKDYPVEKIAPAVLTEDDKESHHFTYWGPLSHARSYVKGLSLQAAYDAPKNPNNLCAPYNTTVTLTAGKTWTVKDFEITGKPACDVNEGQLHCDTAFEATCVAN